MNWWFYSLYGHLTDRTFGLRSALHGVAGFRSWHCYSESHQLSCRLDRVCRVLEETRRFTIKRRNVFGTVGGTCATTARLMKSMAQRKVFISYSLHDVEWARSFAQALKKRGISVWFDQFEVEPGESIRDALESGLRSSDILVALLDPESPSNPTLFLSSVRRSAWGKNSYRLSPRSWTRVRSRWTFVCVVT